ncbi:MAG TPA: CcdB family protein [Hyphomonas sp.]|nr:CcdB family protein [Hyphomonas sp.]HRX73349.1 CcdB family protein [Hyphomonas sp.]
MQRLAVYRLSGKKPPVVILQYPDLDTGDFVLAAPLYPAGAARPIEVITPEVSLNETAYLVGTHLLAGIRRNALIEPLGDLMPYEYEISRAISRLFFGN